MPFVKGNDPSTEIRRKQIIESALRFMKQSVDDQISHNATDRLSETEDSPEFPFDIRSVISVQDEKEKHCPKCDKYYSNKHNLRKHVRRSHNPFIRKPESSRTNNGLKCQLCGEEFSEKSVFKDHLANFHHVTETFQEKLIKEAMSTSQESDGSSVEDIDGEENYCEICDKFYNSKSSLQKHIKRNHPQNNSQMIGDTESSNDVPDEIVEMPNSIENYCEICLKYFSCRPNWRKHMRNLHGMSFIKNKATINDDIELDTSMDSKKVLEGQENENLASNENRRNLFCPRCVRYYSCMNTWREHMKNVHGLSFSRKSIIPCELPTDSRAENSGKIGNSNVSQENVDDSDLISDENARNLYCPKCVRNYSCRTSWKKHMRKFHGLFGGVNKSYDSKADETDSDTNLDTSFDDEPGVKADDLLNDVHKKNLFCILCKRYYSRTGNWKQHMQNVHHIAFDFNEKTDEESNSEQNSAKEMIDYTELDINHIDISHLVSEKNRNDLYCVICKCAFSHKEKWVEHMKNKHRVSLENITWKENEDIQGKINSNETKDVTKVDEIDIAVLTSQENKKKLYCASCQTKYSSSGNWKRHMQNTHLILFEPGTTNVCEDQTIKIVGQDVDINIDELISEENEAKVYCMICDRNFSRRDNWKQHMKAVHGVSFVSTGSDSNTSIDKTTVKPNHHVPNNEIISEENKKKLYCIVCKKHYSCNGNWKQHMQNVHCLLLSQNTSFNTSFNRQSLEQAENADTGVSVERSELLSEENKKNLYCILCRKTYYRLDNWKSHMENAHPENTATSAASSVKSVKSETTVNTSDNGDMGSLLSDKNANRLYCEKCERHYTDRQGWQKHMRNYHGAWFSTTRKRRTEDDVDIDSSEIAQENNGEPSNKRRKIDDSVEEDNTTDTSVADTSTEHVNNQLSKFDLNALLSTENEENLYCEICSKFYCSNDNWKKHMRRAHRVLFSKIKKNDDGSIVMKDSGSDADLSDEEADDSDIESENEEKLSNEDIYALISEKNQKDLFCEKCSRYYGDRPHWLRHMRMYHGISIRYMTSQGQGQKDDAVDVKSLLSSENEDNLYCEICMRFYSTNHSWKQHMRNHHRISFETRTQIPLEREKLSNIENKEEKMSFKEARGHDLDESQGQSDVISNQSSSEDKNFVDVKSLISKENEDNLYCEICAKFYLDKGSWETHMRKIHFISFKTRSIKTDIETATKQAQKIQSDNSREKNNLDKKIEDESLISAANEQKLFCQMCDKYFTVREGWMKHMRTFHGFSFKKDRVQESTHPLVTKENLDNLYCPSCDRYYSQRSTWIEHMKKQHRAFKNEEKQESDSSNDDMEMLLHCEKCDKCFSNEKAYNDHEAKVHGVGRSNEVDEKAKVLISPENRKNLYCVECNRNYSCTDSWRLHMRNLHGMTFMKPKIEKPGELNEECEKNDNVCEKKAEIDENLHVDTISIDPDIVISSVSPKSSKDKLFCIYCKRYIKTVANWKRHMNAVHKIKIDIQFPYAKKFNDARSETSSFKDPWDDRLSEISSTCTDLSIDLKPLDLELNLATSETQECNLFCEKCRRYFSCKSAYEKHLEKFHGKVKDMMWDSGDIGSDPSTTLRVDGHEMDGMNNSFTSDQEGTVLCEICTKCYTSVESWRKHMKQKHGITLSKEEIDSKVKEISEKTSRMASLKPEMDVDGKTSKVPTPKVETNIDEKTSKVATPKVETDVKQNIAEREKFGESSGLLSAENEERLYCEVCTRYYSSKKSWRMHMFNSHAISFRKGQNQQANTSDSKKADETAAHSEHVEKMSEIKNESTTRSSRRSTLDGSRQFIPVQDQKESSAGAENITSEVNEKRLFCVSCNKYYTNSDCWRRHMVEFHGIRINRKMENLEKRDKTNPSPCEIAEFSSGKCVDICHMIGDTQNDIVNVDSDMSDEMRVLIIEGVEDETETVLTEEEKEPEMNKNDKSLDDQDVGKIKAGLTKNAGNIADLYHKAVATQKTKSKTQDENKSEISSQGQAQDNDIKFSTKSGQDDKNSADKPKAINCDACSLDFGTADEFQKHCQNFHDVSNKDSVSDSDDAKMDTNSESKNWKCKICNRIYSSEYSLGRHLYRIHSMVIKNGLYVKHKVQSRNKSDADTSEVGDNMYKCEDCNKICNGYTLFTRHRKIHQSDWPHVCGTCDHRTESKKELDEHVRKHTNERPLTCHMCQRSFHTVGFGSSR